MKKYKLDDNYYIREVHIDDADDLFLVCQKETVTEFLTWNPHKDINETRFVIANFLLTKEKDNLPNSYAIIDSDNNKAIGLIDFMKGVRSEHIEIGYYIDDNYWNKGIVTKALAKLLEIGFNELNFEEIRIYHEETNLGSKNVIKKNKFKQIGSLKSEVPLKNKTVDLISYSLTKGEYNDE